MHIRQDLVAVPGATMETIKTVVSHPQALAQSGVFVQQHGFKTATWGNTADAARHVAELGDPTVAAIASAETAELYGLQILSPGINAEGDNTTRFIVIERADTARRRVPGPAGHPDPCLQYPAAAGCVHPGRYGEISHEEKGCAKHETNDAA